MNNAAEHIRLHVFTWRSAKTLVVGLVSTVQPWLDALERSHMEDDAVWS